MRIPIKLVWCLEIYTQMTTFVSGSGPFLALCVSPSSEESAKADFHRCEDYNGTTIPERCRASAQRKCPAAGVPRTPSSPSCFMDSLGWCVRTFFRLSKTICSSVAGTRYEQNRNETKIDKTVHSKPESHVNSNNPSPIPLCQAAGKTVGHVRLDFPVIFFGEYSAETSLYRTQCGCRRHPDARAPPTAADSS